MSMPARKASPETRGYDLQRIRADFPILSRIVNGHPLAYLDNGASSQRPTVVIEAQARYYREHHANVHRGVHTLSQEATAAYEGVREQVRAFIGAASTHEIIFTRGTTEAINLVAQSYARPRLKAGDEILISWLEHHANIVPWQMVCEQTGATLKVAPLNPRGEVDFAAFQQLLSPRTRMVALAHVSNALGTIVPVKQFIAAAKALNVPVLLDGAQAVPHLNVDVRDLDCDFYTFSAHKMYGPTGVGVLYGKEALLESMPPWQGGGDMMLTVRFDKTTYNALPYKFEAGTPNIAGVVGFGAGIQYLENLGLDRVAAHEHSLLEQATQKLAAIEGLRLIGTAREKSALVSFVVDRVHPHDLGTILDSEGIAVRTGHHCAMPVMEFFDVPATARASFALYNTAEEVDRLAAGIEKARRMFA